MEDASSSDYAVFIPDELHFLRELIHKIPAIIYINEIHHENEELIARMVWINKTGEELSGYSLSQIIELGNNFYTEILHPDDLVLVRGTFSSFQQNPNQLHISNIYRVRPKGEENYRLMCSHATVLNYHDNKKPHRILSVCFEILNTSHCNDQMLFMLKEILNHNIQLCKCNLTTREKEILNLIVRGYTNPEVAKMLNISVSTAKKHRTNILHKTHVHNTAGLVSFALNSGEL